MTHAQLARVNGTSFVVCVSSIFAAVVVGLCGIWGLIGTGDAMLWRTLGTCGVFFAGAVSCSLAIRCFKTNA